MSDSRLRGRVKGLFGGASPDSELPAEVHTHTMADPEAERQALQVLVLARRTADEHIASAQREGDRIRLEARTKAEEIVGDAQAIAEGVRREADQALSEARAGAEQIVREAKTSADNVRQEAKASADGLLREADKTLSDARAKAEHIVKTAQANADELESDARRQYEDVVGSLEVQRDALREQIEALEHFDHEYRARLASFMQKQLKQLGVEVKPAKPAAAMAGGADDSL